MNKSNSIADKLAAALRYLLENPYPHDLVKIREAAGMFESEDDARRLMSEWCSQRFCDDAMENHQDAKIRALGVLEKYDRICKKEKKS